MYRLGLLTFFVLTPALQAAQPEIRAILLNPAIEGVLERIWSSSGDACKPADPSEDRLRLAAVDATDPSAQIELLDEWEEALPGSPSCDTFRLWLSTLAHARAGHAERAAELGWRLLDVLPRSRDYWFTLAWLSSGIAAPTSEQVAQMQAASVALLSSLESLRLRVEPSEGLPGSAIRDAIAVVGHLAGGVAAYEKKDWAKAQEQLRSARRSMPDSAFFAYKIGSSVMALADPSANDEVLRQFVYAAEHRGPGALSEDDRLAVRAYVRKIWANYTGDKPYEELLEAVRTGAPINPRRDDIIVDIDYDTPPSRPFPQPYWMTLLVKNQPFQDLWFALRNPKSSDSIWKDARGKLMPQMELLVVQTEPVDKPQILFLGAGNKTFVVLNLSEPLAEPVPLGRSIRFEGRAEALQREPFLLTLGEGVIVRR